MYRFLSKWAPVIALAMVVAGGMVGWAGGRGAFIPQLIPYTFEARAADVADVKAKLPAALDSDLWLILGYGLLLGGCALYYRLRASSPLSCLAGNFVISAVVAAVLADLAEDHFLSTTLSPGHDNGWERTAAATAATIKFCTLAVGAVGLIACVAIAFRGIMGAYQRRWASRHAHGSPAPRTKPWWERAMADDDFPQPRAENDAVKRAVEESGQTAEIVIENQRSWVRAYNVPGITEQLKGRTEPLRALCLSGGGVRSACVALGAMQVFSAPFDQWKTARPAEDNGEISSPTTLLGGLDYVISVSGGGYAAGARLLAVQAQHVDPEQKRGKPKAKPLNSIPISARFEEGSPEFDHVRRRSSYIADSPLGMVRALGEVLKNLVASLTIIFSVPVLAGAVLGWLLAQIPMAAFPPVPEGKSTNPAQKLFFVAHPPAYWALAVFAAMAVLFTMAAVFIEWKSDGPGSEGWRIRMSALARISAGFAVVVFAITIALPALMSLCSWAGRHAPSGPGGPFAAISGVVGLNYVAALVAMIWRDTNKLTTSGGAKVSPTLLKRLLPPAVISLLLILATLAVLLAVWLVLLGGFAAGFFDFTAQSGRGFADVVHKGWWLAGLALIVSVIGFADVTSLSLHPFYRRRLAQAFAVRRTHEKGKPVSAAQYPAKEPTWLHEYGRASNGPNLPGPKFVFACSATVTGPNKPAPGLNAVSYVMSADVVGGPELGWFHTKGLFDAAPSRLRRDMTVEAAVAVSGAAFASAMGRQDKGIEKLLAISGARLGTWLPNPNFVRQLRDAESGRVPETGQLPRVWPKSLPSVRGAGYLYREILGINNEDARLVQITDGGHYDNSGLVEALRRRCRMIIVIDGGGDPPPLPLGLTDALRLAKYELGVDIKLKSTGPYSVSNIAPGSGTQFPKRDALAGLNGRITRGAVVRGDISYPAAAGLMVSTGTLVFVKAVVSEKCPYWLLTYAASSEIFPHDPTSDQWFNEGQFAAYTELGRVIAREAVECIRQCQPASTSEPAQPSFHESAVPAG